MKWLRAMLAVVAVVIMIGITFLYQHSDGVNNGESGNATVIISINYGSKNILKKEVRSGISALDALKSVANVSTSYGGSFVSGINGIYGNVKKQVAWFYYINGLLANVGANHYVLHSGDVMRWDYHHWSMSFKVSAELADFPEPFIHGYEGKKRVTVIVYEDKYKEYAEQMYKYLDGRCRVRMINEKNINDDMEKRYNLIVFGTDYGVGADLNSHYEELGFMYHVKGNAVLDRNETTYKGAFAELAQSPYNPNGTWSCQNVVLLIGGDGSYMPSLLSLLIKSKVSGFWAFAGERS